MLSAGILLLFCISPRKLPITYEENASKRTVRSAENVCKGIYSSFLTGVEGNNACRPQFPTTNDCLMDQGQQKVSVGGSIMPNMRIVECEATGEDCWNLLQLQGHLDCTVRYLQHGLLTSSDCASEACAYILEEILQGNMLLPVVVYVTCDSLHSPSEHRLILPRRARAVSREADERTTNGSNSKTPITMNILLLSSMSRWDFYQHLGKTEALLRSLSLVNHSVADFPLYQHVTLGTTVSYVQSLLLGATVNQTRLHSDTGSLLQKYYAFSYSACGEEREQFNDYLYSMKIKHFSFLDTVYSNLICVIGRDIYLKDGTNNKASYLGFLLRWTVLFASYKSEIQEKTRKGGISVTVVETVGGHGMLYSDVDTALQEYLQSVKTLSGPSVTLILAAAGTAPRKYPHVSSWQLLQQDNPVMLAVSHQLENKSMWNSVLAITSDLVTIWDIHTITDWISRDMDSSGPGSSGLVIQPPHVTMTKLQDLTAHRSCSAVPISQPNLCICRDQYVTFSNDTLQVGKAEFVIATLNNLLQRQVNRTKSMLSSSHSAYGVCQKLVALAFIQVQIQRVGDTIRTVLLIEVTGFETMSKYKSATSANVALLSATVDTIFLKKKQQMKLVHYTVKHRGGNNCDILPDSCDLCLCHSNEYTLSRNATLQRFAVPQFGMKATLINLHHACLFLAVRNFLNSVSFYALNTCDDRVYRLTLFIYGVNIVSSNPKVVRDIECGPEYFLSVAIQASYYDQLQTWYKHTFTVFYTSL